MDLLLPGMLGVLPYQSGITTRQISAENPTGGKGEGCRWDPNPDDPFLRHSGPSMKLGRGWKVRPFISVGPQETAVLADIEGPGCISQFFVTSDLPEYRALVLRCYWDEEETPSVETPLGDFFAMGHDTAPHAVNSLPIVVDPYRGCNSYWQMPFRRRARITLQNEADREARIVAYRVLYQQRPVPDDAAYLHAQWRRGLTRLEHPEYTIVDGITGRASMSAPIWPGRPCRPGGGEKER